MRKTRQFFVTMPNGEILIREAESLLHAKIRLKEEYPGDFQKFLIEPCDIPMSLFRMGGVQVVAPDIDFAQDIFNSLVPLQHHTDIQSSPVDPASELPMEPSILTNAGWKSL